MLLVKAHNSDRGNGRVKRREKNKQKHKTASQWSAQVLNTMLFSLAAVRRLTSGEAYMQKTGTTYRYIMLPHYNIIEHYGS